MTKLDKQLREILEKSLEGEWYEYADAISNIKRVFKADGWIDSDDLKMSPSQVKSMNREEPDGSVRQPKMGIK